MMERMMALCVGRSKACEFLSSRHGIDAIIVLGYALVVTFFLFFLKIFSFLFPFCGEQSSEFCSRDRIVLRSCEQ